MDRWGHTKRTIILSSAVALWLSAPLVVWAENLTVCPLGYNLSTQRYAKWWAV